MPFSVRENNELARLVLLLLFLLSFGCREQYDEPSISLEAYVVEPGFRLEVIAAEPLIESPVAMTFDTEGRIWVVEMPGYMPDIDGHGERAPTGRIVRLADRDGDGRMDHRTVFLDSLVLPRALALAYGGLLYAEPPNLWFVEIDEDRPGRRVLVDSLYAAGGNVEHQPNGLLRHLDNWYYNAKANFRYQRIAGEWIKEVTAFRGQWGITHDDLGRLFYNDNANQLQGDLAPPNLLSRNPHLRAGAGLNQPIATDQRLYPLHAPSVNRGYLDGVLDTLGRVRHFTSASGPVIYRGDQFPAAYYGNAFVCGPEGNLVKRNLLEAQGARLVARQAYDDREFIAATEEAFRPVSLYNAPDGSLYVLDMHHGIIQHRAYLTTYLREQLLAKGLDTIVGRGRILRVVHNERPLPERRALAELTPTDLVELLYSPNGWTRDKAQQLLVEHAAVETAPRLREIFRDGAAPLAQIHALWTLEGLDLLTPDLLLAATPAMDPRLLMHVIRLAERFADNPAIRRRVADLADRADPLIDLQLALSLGQLAPEGGSPDYDLLTSVLDRYPGDSLLIEAALSGLAGREDDFRQFLVARGGPVRVTAPLLARLDEVLARAAEAAENPPEPTFATRTDARTRGMELFGTHCATCHGMGGAGIDRLAPPLAGSDYVAGPADRLILLTLHGLSGPIHINGERYEFNAAMPGVKDNPELSDADVAAILTFVKNAFTRQPTAIRAERVGALRAAAPAGYSFTEAELQRKVEELARAR